MDRSNLPQIVAHGSTLGEIGEQQSGPSLARYEASSGTTSSSDRAGPSPPIEPTADRFTRRRRRFQHRAINTTESQGYWAGYAPTPPPLPELTLNPHAARFVSTRAPLQQPHATLGPLRGMLAHLQRQASYVAEAYRNFGLLFHSFPAHVFWHDAIHQEIRTFARADYRAGGDGSELPDIIHVIGTLESYEKMLEYYGAAHVVPLYIEVEDGERLSRALARERQQEQPKYKEMCRRFLADEEDFSEENLRRLGISRRFCNGDAKHCLEEITEVK